MIPRKYPLENYEGLPDELEEEYDWTESGHLRMGVKEGKIGREGEMQTTVGSSIPGEKYIWGAVDRLLEGIIEFRGLTGTEIVYDTEHETVYAHSSDAARHLEQLGLNGDYVEI